MEGPDDHRSRNFMPNTVNSYYFIAVKTRGRLDNSILALGGALYQLDPVIFSR